MAKTQQQYYDAGKKTLDQQKKAWQATDAATLEQINAGIDKAAQTAAGQYEQRITAAPLESRVQYDQNAVAEAVTKKQVQERLANMGVTDSGLNASMQTAMAVQKQKADAGVRADEAAKIREAQNMIDQILAEAEISKNDQKMSLERATNDRYNAALQDLLTSSQQAAATEYAADQEYAAQKYAADQEYLAKLYEAQNASSAEQTPWDWTGRTDDYGNHIFLHDGKEYTFAKGLNPAVGAAHPDAKYGVRSNGYQPDNLGEMKDENGKGTGVINKLSVWPNHDITVNGKKQNIWMDQRGRIYYWSDYGNQYVELDKANFQ